MNPKPAKNLLMADPSEAPATIPGVPAASPAPPATTPPPAGEENSKVSKEEVSKALNDLLGVKVNWARLSGGDLTQLVNAFDNQRAMAERLLRQLTHGAIDEMALGDRPLVGVLLDRIPEGPFGLVRRIKKQVQDRPGGGLLG